MGVKGFAKTVAIVGVDSEASGYKTFPKYSVCSGVLCQTCFAARLCLLCLCARAGWAYTLGVGVIHHDFNAIGY